MNGIGTVATNKVAQMVAASAAFRQAQIRTQNAAPDLADRVEPVTYPAIYVYCEKIVNNLVEKFRSFSGTLQMVVEVRASQEKLNGLQDGLDGTVDSVMELLDGRRGDWGDGMFYCGGYQVAFGAAKSGGKNYCQAAKVTFEIGVSIT